MGEDSGKYRRHINNITFKSKIDIFNFTILQIKTDSLGKPNSDENPFF